MYSLVCFGIGGVLFLLSVLLKRPDGMRLLAALLHWPPHGKGNTLAVLGLITFSIGSLLAATMLQPVVRQVGRQRRASVRDTIAAGVCLVLFLFTLVPVGPIGREIVLYLALATSGMTLLLIGSWPLPRRWCESIIRAVTHSLRHVQIGAFLGALFLVEFAATNLVSYAVFAHIPHLYDGIVQLFEAILFAHGRVGLPAPEHGAFFTLTNILTGPSYWYPSYPPHHALMLAAGVLLGMPWIINPLLGSLTVVMVYFVGKEMYGDTLGRVAACLAAVSPFLLFMSSEFMNHSTALFFMTVFLWGFARMVRTQQWAPAAVAGVALGMATVRPLTAVAMSLPFQCYSAVLLVRSPRRFLPPLIVLGLAACLPLVLFLAHNYEITGSALTTGYTAMGQHLGFGAGLQGPPYTPKRAVAHALVELVALQKYLFEAPLPSLSLVLVLFLARHVELWDWLLLASWVSLTIAYRLYWYEHLHFGPRYQFEALVAVVLLSARGIQHLPQLVRERLGVAVGVQRVHSSTALVLAFCVIVMLSVNLPPLIATYSNSYLGVNDDIYNAVRRQNVHNAVIFVNSNYSSAFLGTFSDRLDFQGDLVYARNVAGAGPVLMQSYPDRRYFMADGSKLDEVHDASPLIAAQVRKWNSQWNLEGCEATNSGVVRASDEQQYVLQTYSAGDQRLCALTGNFAGVLPGQVLALRVRADNQAASNWRLRVSVNGQVLDDRTVAGDGSAERWQTLRYDLSAYAGQSLSVRLEHLPIAGTRSVGYWSSARVESMAAQKTRRG
ncbi:MAG TPA: glycosyltransferase family 39 protein [Candidatus Binatia bacterium]|nr:glycosyltransferase family 39 protein [Candidatus Binatia bacterium]